MPIECRPSFGAMSSPGTGRSFSVAENERLRALARGMLEKVDNNQRRLADLLGVAQPTVSNFIAGKTGAGVQLATAIARQAGLSLQSATGGGDVAGSPRWRDLPGWAAAVAAAMLMFPKVSVLAFEQLGNLMGEKPPSVTPLTIGLLASTWDNVSSDDARADAIRANALREMAEEDLAATAAIKARHQARERGEPLPPLPGEPPKRTRRAPPKPSR